MRLTRSFRINGIKLQGNLDLYNLFNEDAVLQVNTRYGPAWLQPTNILGPRTIKIGFQLDM